jgi:hypothetical protein
MRRFLCVCALILTGMLSTAGCGAMNPVSNEPEPVSAADCSPMPASSAESKQEPAYPQPYAALTGVLKQPLTTDLYWYFDPLLGDNVGYLNMDGAVVWNTTTAASRDAAEKYRQEHPWVDTEQKISTFFGNGSCAVAEGKILGHGESWWSSESNSVGRLIADWNGVAFLLYDETLANSGVPVAMTSGGELYGIELKEQSGQKTVFQNFSLQAGDFVMGLMETQGYQESGCDYGVLTCLTIKGTLKAARFPLALGLNTDSIEKVMQGGDGETALPLPNYAAYDGVAAVESAGFTLPGSAVSAKLILMKNGTLLCDDGMGNVCVVARRIVKMAGNGLLNPENGAGEGKLLIDEENCVIRLGVFALGQRCVPTLETVGFCEDWTKIVSVQRGYAVKTDGTVERVDRTGNTNKTFFEDITDIKKPPEQNG